MRSAFVLFIAVAVLATALGASAVEINAEVNVPAGAVRRLQGTDAVQKAESVQKVNWGGYGGFGGNPYGGWGGWPSYGSNSYAGANANAWSGSGGGPWGGNSYAGANANAWSGSNGGWGSPWGWGGKKRLLHRKML